MYSSFSSYSSSSPSILPSSLSLFSSQPSAPQHPTVASLVEQASRDPMLHDLNHWIVRVQSTHSAVTHLAHSTIQPFTLPNRQRIAAVSWNNQVFITGTDIVKLVLFRFEHIGAFYGVQVCPLDLKKFEEGVFSDLRNLKTGTGAVLENAKSEFLVFLHKNKCIKTLKKQRVFVASKVRFERLLLNAINRDAKHTQEDCHASRHPTSPACNEDAARDQFLDADFYDQALQCQWLVPDYLH